MKVLILKNGTIPAGVAEVLYEDEAEEAIEEVSDGHELLELFDVEGRPEAVVVSWADGMGFSVDPCTFEEGLKWLQEQANLEGISEVTRGHLVCTYTPDKTPNPDREAYYHLFDLRGD